MRKSMMAVVAATILAGTAFGVLPATAAEHQVQMLNKGTDGPMAFEPSWWELAYDADDNLVGLVMPARSPTFLTIGYIGIVPEQRGHGYVNDLLARGTATLRAASGDDAIRADTDLDNAPMAAAFERAGYRRFATRREYEIRL